MPVPVSVLEKEREGEVHLLVNPAAVGGGGEGEQGGVDDRREKLLVEEKSKEKEFS